MRHPVPYDPDPKVSTPVSQPDNQDKQMSLKPEPFNTVAASAPEPLGAVVGKVGLVWTGFFMGMTLGEWVLLATLTYTLLQIAVLIVERIIKPVMAAREVRQALKKSGIIRAKAQNTQEN